MPLTATERRVAWGTADELLFIRHIGRFSVAGKDTQPLELLLKYRVALLYRVDWTNVDRAQTILAVDRHINDLSRDIK